MVGYKLFSRGGNILEKDEIGASTGTTIKVENYFIILQLDTNF